MAWHNGFGLKSRDVVGRYTCRGSLRDSSENVYRQWFSLYCLLYRLEVVIEKKLGKSAV